MSGAEALMLVTLGYEIAGRAGLALHATVSDYHTSGAWNALGSRPWRPGCAACRRDSFARPSASPNITARAAR